MHHGCPLSITFNKSECVLVCLYAFIRLLTLADYHYSPLASPVNNLKQKKKRDRDDRNYSSVTALTEQVQTAHCRVKGVQRQHRRMHFFLKPNTFEEVSNSESEKVEKNFGSHHGQLHKEMQQRTAMVNTKNMKITANYSTYPPIALGEF